MKLDITKYKVFFFDFDGVIVDSLGIKAEAFGNLFEEHGQDIVRKVIDYHLNNGGVSRYEKFKYYYSNLFGKEITPEIINRLDKRYSSLVMEKVVAASAIDGVMDFIKRLKNKGKLCFLISATPEKEIRKIVRLRKIEGIFKEIVGSPKKKVENLRYLLDKYDIKPEEAVYFGDARSDYEAAVQNSVDFVGVGNEKNQELNTLQGINKIENFVGV